MILRIKIVRQKDGLTFTQSSYIEKILKKLNHFECAPAPTPFSPSIQLIRNKGRIVASYRKSIRAGLSRARDFGWTPHINGSTSMDH